MDVIIGLFMLALGAALYFLPTIIASRADRENAGAICLLNIFLGWTLIGWVGALVWASTKAPRIKDTSA